MDKDTQFWQFKNSADNSEEATLYIYGDIVTYDLGARNYPDDVVPNKFKNELNALGDVGTIHVRINSGGGSAFAAYAIMNLLKTHKAKIITYNDGIAASAATIIAMAGDKIVTALGSVWMVHLPSVFLFGSADANDLRKVTDMLNTVTQSMVDIYHKRTSIERAEIEQMLNDDTWLTGTQALEKGFVDEVTDLEVAASLSEDMQAAFFNGQKISLDKVRNKEMLVGLVRGPQSALSDIPMVSPRQPAKTPGKAIAAAVPPQNKPKEENIVNLEDLKAKHPELYAAAIEEGKAQGSPTQEALAAAREEGVQAERARIREIDAMALPGMEQLTNKAKFESGVSAGEYAVELVKAQKQKGESFLTASKADAADVADVPAGAAPQNGNDEEEQALLAHTADRAKTLR